MNKHLLVLMALAFLPNNLCSPFLLPPLFPARQLSLSLTHTHWPRGPRQHWARLHKFSETHWGIYDSAPQMSWQGNHWWVSLDMGAAPVADNASSPQTRPPDQVVMAFWGALKSRGTLGALWAGAPVAWISCFIDVVFASGSACVYSSRFPHQAGNFPAFPLKPTGAVLSKSHNDCSPTSTWGGPLVSPTSVFHRNFCLTLVTPKLLWHLFLKMWLLLPPLPPPARGTLSEEQPSSWRPWGLQKPLPSRRTPCPLFPLQFACWSLTSRIPSRHHVTGCSTAGQPSLYAVGHFISPITLPPKPSCACV